MERDNNHVSYNIYIYVIGKQLCEIYIYKINICNTNMTLIKNDK